MTAQPQELRSTAPPLQQAPQQLVVLLGNKLIGLDSILPVLMELKMEAPTLDVHFVFMNRKAAGFVARNYALQRAMEATGKIEILAEGAGSPVAKARAALRLIRWVTSLFARRTLLLSYADLGRFPLNILANAARRGGGAACTYCKASYPGNPALNYAHGLKTVGRDMRWRDAGDAFLIYHPSQLKDYAEYSNAPAALLGTPRRLPAWRRFLDQLVADEGIRDEEGRGLGDTERPTFAVFYSGPAIIPYQADDVRETFLRVLDSLAAEAPGALVVVKPHPICDLKLLRSDIAGRDCLDIRISHAHPQLLMQIATLAISTNASNVIYDCYLEGVPVVETTHYKPDVLEIGDSLYPNRGRLGGADDAAFRAAVRMASTSPQSLPKPDVEGLVWPKPPSLAAALWGARAS